MNKKRTRPTVYDIARAADVSPATVSRVLSDNNYPVSQELRERVISTATELHYSAKSKLRTDDSNVVVMVPNLSNVYYSELISGLEAALRSFGMNMLLVNTRNDLRLEKQLVRDLGFDKKLKLIVSPVCDQLDHMKSIIGSGIPLVLLEQNASPMYSSITSDYHRSAELAVEYLLNNGCKKVAFFGMALNRPSRTDVYNGYCDGLKSVGLEVNSSLVFFTESSPSPQDEISPILFGSGLAERLVKSGVELPDAICCSNDMLAIGAMKYFSAAGIRVPADISIVGMDNLLLASVSTPALTTIDYHTYELGKNAARLLYSQMSDENRKFEHVVIPPTLIERDSVLKRIV